MSTDNLKRFITDYLRRQQVHDEFKYAVEQIGSEYLPLAYEMITKRLLQLNNELLPTYEDEKTLKDWEAYLKEMDALPPGHQLLLKLVDRTTLLRSCSLFVQDGLLFYHLQQHQKSTLEKGQNNMERFLGLRNTVIEQWLKYPKMKELTDEISQYYTWVMLTEEKMTFNEMGGYCFLAGYLTGLGWEEFQKQSQEIC